jgi:hypothetical protein
MAIGENVFTPTVPASNQFSNTDLNALGSNYASLYGHATTDLIQRQIRYAIYDAAPKMYYDDLKILKSKPAENKKSDEFFYLEKVFGRNSIIATAVVAAGSTQVIPVTATSTTITSVDMIVTYPNNAKGTISNVDTTLNQITVQAMTGSTLPAVAVNDVLAQLSTIAADGTNKISTYMRLNTVERTNYIQLFARATRFGEVELYKYKNAGTTDYLDNNRQEVMNQFRIDLSNCYWNGLQGEVTLSDGSKAKTMGGVVPIMQAAGSPAIATTVANIAAAFEDLVLSTQFESAGFTKFLYATPRRLNDLQNAYKRVLTRYTPDNMLANLKLNQIEMEGTNVVLVPVKRFEEASCYPASFANQYILLDQESISCCEMWGERMGDTLDRPSNVNLNTYRDFWVDGNMSIRYDNPLAGGTITVS